MRSFKLKDLWNSEEKKVFLANFSDSKMQLDSKNKYSKIDDFWRIKTYVKDEDKLNTQFEREFPEPYQVAQYYCGGTWNDYNSPFVIQIGLCNLNCEWCFVDKSLRNMEKGAYFSAHEIIEIWYKNTNCGVLRITGGEPFLAPDFLIEIGKEIKTNFQKHRYLWIDTNLLGFDYQRVVNELSHLDIPFGICGCFKGFDEKNFQENTKGDPKLFNTQFENAKKILSSLKNKGQLFFYIPEFTSLISENEMKPIINHFFNQLRQKIHQNAPLRITVLKIKKYEVNKNFFLNKEYQLGLTRKIWFELIKSNYPIDLIWLPQYQINLN
jgi:uncharacterized Fe-S cluster-containing radical SAM superfamily protein